VDRVATGSAKSRFGLPGHLEPDQASGPLLHVNRARLDPTVSGNVMGSEPILVAPASRALSTSRIVAAGVGRDAGRYLFFFR
jgi:hypothetical protein